MAETDPVNVGKRRKYLHWVRIHYWQASGKTYGAEVAMAIGEIARRQDYPCAACVCAFTKQYAKTIYQFAGEIHPAHGHFWRKRYRQRVHRPSRTSVAGR